MKWIMEWNEMVFKAEKGCKYEGYEDHGKCQLTWTCALCKMDCVWTMNKFSCIISHSQQS